MFYTFYRLAILSIPLFMLELTLASPHEKRSKYISCAKDFSRKIINTLDQKVANAGRYDVKMLWSENGTNPFLEIEWYPDLKARTPYIHIEISDHIEIAAFYGAGKYTELESSAKTLALPAVPVSGQKRERRQFDANSTAEFMQLDFAHREPYEKDEISRCVDGNLEQKADRILLKSTQDMQQKMSCTLSTKTFLQCLNKVVAQEI